MVDATLLKVIVVMKERVVKYIKKTYAVCAKPTEAIDD